MIMKRTIIALAALAMTAAWSITVSAATDGQARIRKETVLTEWQFRRDHDMKADEGWEEVSIPHDWAISGPFSVENDLQVVAVIQNGEKEASRKTGRSGGLPYMGKGCYRRTIDMEGPVSGRKILLFDGAMSEAQIFVNGEKVFEWPYGYNSFSCDVTDALHEGRNEIAVLLENRPFSSRWYPGAGLYRKVRLLEVPEVHVPVWGTFVTTPHVEKDYASVRISIPLEGAAEGEIFEFRTRIEDNDGNVVAERADSRAICHGDAAVQNLTVENPVLWSPESPALYTAVTEISRNGEAVDVIHTRFGIRTVEYIADKGFFLNGKRRVIKGVCLHHDLGPLGAAVNRSAIRHQLGMLKDMGCDAIRTSHNMPAEELVELCDEMGFMLMPETFDEWDVAKCENGYHRFFGEWAEKDVVNMVRHFRNSPSVIMWSIGNEVPTQRTSDGYKVASWLQSICHREDPTRAVTCGMDQFDAVVNNGFAAQLDLPGFNYKTRRYTIAYGKLPQNIILGSETASTVSSRGVYHLPGEAGSDGNVPENFDGLAGASKKHKDHQSSSYDTEYCYWSNIPDVDFAADEAYPWMAGQFVWTGFDYLGEPTPYDTDAWPNHSSMFGIIDLASIPKDRYYLYRSVWNTESPTLHVLPHWTWPGKEGRNIPVVVYTSYPAAELFINGVSQGVRKKECGDCSSWNGVLPSDRELMDRYRLVWPGTVYSPGEVKVVAYDSEGNPAEEKVVRTAGKPYCLNVKNMTEAYEGDSGSCCRNAGPQLVYLNVSVTDRESNPVPADSRLVNVKVSGNGTFKAIANGDPTCLEAFQEPKMHLFSGQLTVIVERGDEEGLPITVEVSAKGLGKGRIIVD